MEQADNLLLRIQKYDKTFSKGQKRLAAYVLKNYDKAVFLTASKLGKEVGVSESTTVRFATQLGYKGFPEFHRALEELVRNKLNSIQRMKVTYGHVPEAEILDTVFQSDIEIIKLTMEHIDHAAFEMAVGITNLRTVCVNNHAFYRNVIAGGHKTIHPFTFDNADTTGCDIVNAF